MSDYTKKFADFFRSDYKTIKDFDNSLNESAVAAAWSEAVTLWRSGIKKMKENDLSGIEDIKKANEALKVVVGKSSSPDVQKQADQLNESVNTMGPNSDVEEEIEMLEYQVGALYDKLETAGSTNLEDPELSNTCDDLLEDDTEDESIIDSTVSNVVAPEEVQLPTEVTAPVKKSGYQEGFESGKNRFKKGENAKSMVREVVEGELREEAYSFVQRYQEGFTAGFQYAEELARDLTPEMFSEEI